VRASFLLLATTAVAGFVSPSQASLGPSRRPSIGCRRAEKSPQALTSTVLTQTVAPAIGAALANGMFFSGLPEVLNKRRAGALGEFNPLPMPIVMSNTMGWTIYSFLTRDRFVAMANMPGLLLSCWYMMTMMRLATDDKAKRIEVLAMAMAAVHIAAGAVCAFFLPTRAAMISLYGLVCNGVLLMYYGAPLSSLKTVLADRSAESIYYPTVALNGANSLFWSTYALAIRDRYLLVPNAIGIALAAVQTVLCVAFGKFSGGRGPLTPEAEAEEDYNLLLPDEADAAQDESHRVVDAML